MKFQIEDIIHNRLTHLEFYKKYNRYFKNGIMLDTAPLFTFLIGGLSTRHKNYLLQEEFRYTIKHYNILIKFLKLCNINNFKIIITPQILFELLSHFQKAYSKLKEEKDKENVLKEFKDNYTELLKSIHKDISTWDILKDGRMKFLECADISFILYANTQKHTALLTQDSIFHREASTNEKILAIDFDKLIMNSQDIPEQLLI